MQSENAVINFSGWLGDFIWLVPTIKGIKSIFPSLSLIVSEQQKPLANILQERGLVEKVYVDNKKHRASTSKKVRAELREQKPIFIDFVGKFKTAIYAPFLGGTNGIFIPYKSDSKETQLYKTIHPFAKHLPPKVKTAHMVDQYFNCTKETFGFDIPINFDFPFSTETQEKAEKLISQHELKGAVLLNVGSAQYSKIWPAKNYLALAQRIQNELEKKVAIMGAEDFRWNNNYDLLKAFPEFQGKDFPVFIEGHEFATNAYILRNGKLGLVIGSDSYPGHMAGSANEVEEGTPGSFKAPNQKSYLAPTKSLTFNGPTNLDICQAYDPTGKFNTRVGPDNHNLNCLESRCTYDGKTNVCKNYGKIPQDSYGPCIASISVDKVFQKVKISFQPHKSL